MKYDFTEADVGEAAERVIKRIMMHLHTREKKIFSTERDAEAFMKKFHQEIGRRLNLVEERRLSDRINFVDQALAKEEKSGIATIAKTPIAEIRKELQVVLKNRNIGMER